MFPHTISRTTETFTPSEIAFLYVFLSLWSNLKNLSKCPRAEKFYELPSSRAVVEFLTNTGFTASCFLGALLVAFAQIKDFHKRMIYIRFSLRCSRHTLSSYSLCPNISLQNHINLDNTITVQVLII